MAEESIPQETATARRRWQWSWWKALLGAVAIIVVLGGGLQSGIIGAPHILDHVYMRWDLPLTLFFGGLSLAVWGYWCRGRRIEFETDLAIIACTVGAALLAHSLIWGVPLEENCKIAEGVVAPILDSVRELCISGRGSLFLLQSYIDPAWWLAGAVTGALGGTGLYWLLPHRTGEQQAA